MKYIELLEYPKTAIKNILKGDTAYSDLLLFLKRYKWKKLGKGVFGTVFESKKFPYVIKIFKKDSCYIKFVKYCLQNQSNPHLPKFKGNILSSKLNPNIFGVRMEKLEPIKITSHEHYNIIYNIINYAINLKMIEHMTKTDNGYTLTNNSIKIFEEDYPDFAKIIRELKELKCFFAIKPTNMMMRDSTLVFTDPLFDYNDLVIE